MKKTNDAEHNTYAMAIAEVVTNFLNDCESGNENAVNEATDVLTKKFSLDIQQKAAMKIILSHMELAVHNIADGETLSHWVGLNVNIMARIAVKDWQDVIDRLN